MKVLKNVNLYGKITDISVEGGKIKSIGKCDTDGIDFGGKRIFPGLIDIHIHGCIGCDTMDGNSLEKMSEWLLENGTTAWYPTTMTESEEKIVRATSQNIDFRQGATVLGFHLEGPFINKKFKGAMNEKFITPPKESLVNKCKNIARITLAPETDQNFEFIKSSAAQISIGHTDADYDTVIGAFAAGATSLTHTYNAMNGIHHRAPGPIGAGSDCENVFAELICDGKHIHASSIRMLIKIFGTDRVILISDSMKAAGVPDGEYEFGGQTMIVKDRTALTLDGHLAGSTVTLFECVKKAIEFGVDEITAVKMASENPARLMKLNKGKIEVGYDADFIIVDDSFNLVKAIARGEF